MADAPSPSTPESQRRASRRYESRRARLSPRLPKDWVEGFRAWCRENGRDQAEVIRAALDRYMEDSDA